MVFTTLAHTYQCLELGFDPEIAQTFKIARDSATWTCSPKQPRAAKSSALTPSEGDLLPMARLLLPYDASSGLVAYAAPRRGR